MIVSAMEPARPHGAEFWRAAISSEARTHAVAAVVAHRARAGDVILLEGGLGAGKTAFARGFLLARARAAGERDRLGETPSPTFTLVQIYALGGIDIWHVDLYRIENESEILELGLEEAFSSAISLIEWPDRLGGFCPRDPLRVAIDPIAGCGSLRSISLIGGEIWRDRMAAALEDFH